MPNLVSTEIMLFAVVCDTGLIFGMCFIVCDADKIGVHFLFPTRRRFGVGGGGGGGGGVVVVVVVVVRRKGRCGWNGSVGAGG